MVNGMPAKTTSFSQTLGNLRHGETLIDQLEKAIERSMEDTVDYIKNGKSIRIEQPNLDDEDQPIVDHDHQPGVHDFVTILEGSTS